MKKQVMRATVTLLALLASILPHAIAPANAVAGSILFNGSNYLSANAPYAKLNFGTGDFTIEWWQKFSSSNSGAAARVFSFGCYPSQKFQASIEGGTLYLGINDSWVLYPSLSNYLDKWSHIAIVRSGSTLRIYQNGSEKQNTSYSTSIDMSAQTLAIGAENSNCAYRSSTYFGGLLAKLRMVKSAVYTSSFTPSTSYGLVANTVFMLDADTSAPLSDSGNTGSAITFNNNGSTGVASNSESPALPKQSQATLSVSQSTVAYKNDLALTTSGGSGSGSVSFVRVSGPCTVSGSTLTPTGAGTCVVNATKAGDATYDAVTSANKSISITAQTLTLSGISIANKTYNGNTSASIVGYPTLVGLLLGDTVTLSSGSAAATFANATVGANKAVTVSGYSISGGNSAGYTLSQPSGLTASILAGQVAISASIPTSSAYRAPTNISVSTGSVAGRVTFYLGKVRIAGCINKAVTAAGSYGITCAWKPAGSGALRPHAIFTPNDSNYSPVTYFFDSINVARRTSPR
jgi:hypothetical protein